MRPSSFSPLSLPHLDPPHVSSRSLPHWLICLSIASNTFLKLILLSLRGNMLSSPPLTKLRRWNLGPAMGGGKGATLEWSSRQTRVLGLMALCKRLSCLLHSELFSQSAPHPRLVHPHSVYTSAHAQPLYVVSRLWNRYSVLQAHSKVHHVPSLLSLQGAFWPRKPIMLFSKTFSQLFRRIWIPSWCPYSIYFKSASFPRYLGETISPSSTTVLPLTRHP